MINKRFLLLLAIIILAAILRLYQIGNNPASLDWDEASLGYNAYSLLKTGKDEFGRVWPISIRSFEDYKPAVYAYLTIPSVALFGLNEFAVRLPAALFGIATVIITYFLAKNLFNQKYALLISFLLAISPWHLQFSRVAFEADVALFFVVLGIWAFLSGLKNGKLFILSALSFAVSFYTYHSPRLVIPLLLFGWTIIYRREIIKQKKYVIIGLIIGLLVLLPFVKEAFGEGKARLKSVTVITAEDNLKESITNIEYDKQKGDWLGVLLHNRRIEYAKAIAKGYLDHFNLDFLFIRGDGPLRHHAVDMGMLYIWEAPFILLGILVLLKSTHAKPLFWWFLVAPVASAITSGTPHAVRALLYLPIYQIFTASGLLAITRNITKHKNLLISFYISLIAIIFISVFYYLQMYYIYSPIEAAKDWQYGYKQAVIEAAKYETEVDKIIMTYEYDQPHIYVLFYRQIDPAWYQMQWSGGEVKRSTRAFGKYEFRTIVWEKDQNLKNTLFIGTPEEIPESASGFITDIKYPDGSVAFRIVKS